MPEIKNIFDIAGRAMASQMVRLNTVASNLANAGTISGSKEEAYKSLKPVFETQFSEAIESNGVSTVDVVGIKAITRDPERVFMPNHPSADGEGYVYRAAVDENEDIASFSSYGPNSKGILKPNIVAQGKNTVIANSDNQVMTGNGTSFSSPVNAGMLACLWGSNSDQSASSIKEAVYKSADRYLNPNHHYGYGVPNYYAAHQYLNHDFVIPINESINQDVSYNIYTVDGRVIDSGILYYNSVHDEIKVIKPSSPGVYIIHLFADGFELKNKFIVFE